MLQIIEKAIHFAYIDSFYILPLIGSLQFLLTGILSKEKKINLFKPITDNIN